MSKSFTTKQKRNYFKQLQSVSHGLKLKMAGFSKNPFGGGSFNSGNLGSSNLFGTASKDKKNESSGIFIV